MAIKFREELPPGGSGAARGGLRCLTGKMPIPRFGNLPRLPSKLFRITDGDIARCAVAPSAGICFHRQNSMANSIRFFIE